MDVNKLNLSYEALLSCHGEWGGVEWWHTQTRP